MADKSECWKWDRVQFYQVAQARAPRNPEPGDRVTVELEWVGPHTGSPSLTRIKWPSGFVEGFAGANIAKLDWQPPPPPPWIPTEGEPASWHGEPVKVIAIADDYAWVRSPDGYYDTAPVSHLYPPKGGEA